MSVDIPEDAKEWLSIASIKQNGTSAELTFKAAPNEGGIRSTELTLATVADGKTYTTLTTITQQGGIQDVSVADFNAAADAMHNIALRVWQQTFRTTEVSR